MEKKSKKRLFFFQELCYELCEKFNLDPHKVIFRKMSSSMGHIYEKRRLITLDWTYSDSKLADILQHELVHAKIAKQYKYNKTYKRSEPIHNYEFFNTYKDMYGKISEEDIKNHKYAKKIARGDNNGSKTT